jgi:hypothetical protein
MKGEVVIPDIAGVVVGWRAWSIERGGALLSSVVQDTLWPPRERFEAECHRPHAVPDKKCSCGLYAARTLDHLAEMVYHRYGGDDFVVVGEVALWGGVIPGTQGWRAQYGYPRRLLVPFEAWRLAAGLRDAYRVPVELANTLALGPSVEV